MMTKWRKAFSRIM